MFMGLHFLLQVLLSHWNRREDHMLFPSGEANIGYMSVCRAASSGPPAVTVSVTSDAFGVILKILSMAASPSALGLTCHAIYMHEPRWPPESYAELHIIARHGYLQLLCCAQNFGGHAFMN